MYGKDENEERIGQQKTKTEEQEPDPTIDEVLWAINSLKNGKHQVVMR